jgi:hypothetical protein
VAPAIDRLRMAVMRLAMAPSLKLAGALGLSERGTQLVAMLRNTLPDRVVTDDQLRSLLRYHPVEAVDAGVRDALDADIVDRPAPGELALTDRGRTLAVDMYQAVEPLVDKLWSANGEQVAALLPLTAKALMAAEASGGPAFRVMAPPYEPDGASAAMLIAERLTALRFHRFDAHVSAWQRAGLTVEEVQALAPGPRHDAIEAETNRLAAPPYAVLETSERAELLAALAALPN